MFLNGELNKKVYMEIPEGFEGTRDPTKVCKLNQTLYSLKQAPKIWHLKINSWFLEQGLIKSSVNPNMYYKEKDMKRIIILLYLDDLLLTTNDGKEIKQMQKAFIKNFEMTNLGQ